MPATPALSISADDDAAFARFVDEFFGERPRVLSSRETERLLNQSPRSLDRIVQAGRLQPYQIGTQKRGFLSSDVLKLLWEARKPTTAEAPAPRKPQTPQQRSPSPKAHAAAGEARGRRGRPRRGGDHRVSK
jgi:hypothetical protein